MIRFGSITYSCEINIFEQNIACCCKIDISMPTKRIQAQCSRALADYRRGVPGILKQIGDEMSASSPSHTPLVAGTERSTKNVYAKELYRVWTSPTAMECGRRLASESDAEQRWWSPTRCDGQRHGAKAADTAHLRRRIPKPSRLGFTDDDISYDICKKRIWRRSPG